MSNTKTTTFALAILVIGVFNALFFIWIKPEAPEWVSYGAITLGMLWFAASAALPHPGKGETYSLTLPKTAGEYTFCALVAAIIMYIYNTGIAIAITVHLLLATTFAILYAVNLSANRKTSAATAQHRQAVAEVKNVAFDIKLLIADAQDPQIKKALIHLYDTVAASPAKSTADRSAFNTRIENGLQKLQRAVGEGNTETVLQTAAALEGIYTERNR